MKIGLKLGTRSLAVAVRRASRCRCSRIICVGDPLGDLRPDVDDLVVALAVGDQTLAVLVLDLARPRSFASSRICSLSAGITMSLMPIEMPARVA